MVFDVLRQRATEVLRMPGGEALSVALSPRGDQVFAAGADGTTWRWQLGTMSLAPERILMAKGDEATWTEVSHNGQMIATAYRSGVLEVATNSAPFTVVARFLGHGNAIVRLVFSPDDQQVFTVSTDETLRAWDLHSQRQLFELRLPAAEEERTPLWDFAFLGKDTSAGEAWFAVPLTHGELVIYPLGKVYR
jgi:WD40 repeat protein